MGFGWEVDRHLLSARRGLSRPGRTGPDSQSAVPPEVRAQSTERCRSRHLHSLSLWLYLRRIKGKLSDAPFHTKLTTKEKHGVDTLQISLERY